MEAEASSAAGTQPGTEQAAPIKARVSKEGTLADPLQLVNPLYARPGSKFFSLTEVLARMMPLARALVWVHESQLYTGAQRKALHTVTRGYCSVNSGDVEMFAAHKQRSKGSVATGQADEAEHEQEQEQQQGLGASKASPAVANTTLVRLEEVTKALPTSKWVPEDTSVVLVELPDLKLTFTERCCSNGVPRLYSRDYSDLFVTNARNVRTNRLL